MTRDELIPDFIREILPPLYANAEKPLEAQVAQVKFFYPEVGWTWYGIEFDGECTFFGLVDGFETELGYFDLGELEELGAKFGYAVERDKFFTPQPVGPLYEEARKRRRVLLEGIEKRRVVARRSLETHNQQQYVSQSITQPENGQAATDKGVH
jgi:hypothetical protein